SISDVTLRRLGAGPGTRPGGRESEARFLRRAVGDAAPGIVGFAVFVAGRPGARGPREETQRFAGLELRLEGGLPLPAAGSGRRRRRRRRRARDVGRPDRLAAAQSVRKGG